MKVKIRFRDTEDVFDHTSEFSDAHSAFVEGPFFVVRVTAPATGGLIIHRYPITDIAHIVEHH